MNLAVTELQAVKGPPPTSSISIVIVIPLSLPTSPTAMRSSSSSKRKKWSEEEERTLISKYSDLQSNGTLSRLRTREKKFRPIAEHVTSLHHLLDPISYPFSWSWKDTSTKVQNMRHQYLLVKQKLISSSSASNIIWDDGVSLWPNFLLYKQVFGDAQLPPKAIEPGDGDRLAQGLGFDDDDDGDDDDAFDYDDDSETETPPPPPPPPPTITSVKVNRKKRRRRRRRDEKVRVLEEEEREWEEKMDRRRAEWRKKMEEMLSQHRLHMTQIQARVLNEQQAVIGQILGIVSQWAGAGDVGPPTHGNGVAAMQGEEENHGDGDGQEEDQFILDGG